MATEEEKPARGPFRGGVLQRRDLVQRYMLQGVKPWTIAKTLQVDRATVYRDLKEIQSKLAAAVEMRQLYNLKRCFAELEQEYNEAWILYHQQLPAEKESQPRDDRLMRLTALARVHAVIMARAQLAGYFSPRVLERITMVETAAGRGIKIERLSFEDQTKLRVEELENNEGLARAEGLRPSD